MKTTIHGRLTAIGYLVEHSAYVDEWTGAGMYEAIEKVVKASTTTFDKDYLDELLKAAEHF